MFKKKITCAQCGYIYLVSRFSPGPRELRCAVCSIIQSAQNAEKNDTEYAQFTLEDAYELHPCDYTKALVKKQKTRINQGKIEEARNVLDVYTRNVPLGSASKEKEQLHHALQLAREVCRIAPDLGDTELIRKIEDRIELGNKVHGYFADYTEGQYRAISYYWAEKYEYGVEEAQKAQLLIENWPFSEEVKLSREAERDFSDDCDRIVRRCQLWLKVIEAGPGSDQGEISATALTHLDKQVDDQVFRLACKKRETVEKLEEEIRRDRSRLRQKDRENRIAEEGGLLNTLSVFGEIFSEGLDDAKTIIEKERSQSGQTREQVIRNHLLTGQVVTETLRIWHGQEQNIKKFGVPSVSNDDVSSLFKEEGINILKTLLIGIDNKLREDSGQRLRRRDIDRVESKPEPSRLERAEAVDRDEDFVQQKLKKWRENNLPSDGYDLSRCALESIWKEGWRGKSEMEYLPVFERYEEYERRLRDALET